MKHRLLLVPVLLAAVVVAVSAQATLDLELLKKPPTDAWPTYPATIRQHYSTLKQIDNQRSESRVEWQYRAKLSQKAR